MIRLLLHNIYLYDKALVAQIQDLNDLDDRDRDLSYA